MKGKRTLTVIVSISYIYPAIFSITKYVFDEQAAHHKRS